MDFFEKAKAIESILQKANKNSFAKQVQNAIRVGGTPGESFDTICSLLKTYEITHPDIFNLIKIPAEELYAYATSLGRTPLANFDILDELRG